MSKDWNPEITTEAAILQDLAGESERMLAWGDNWDGEGSVGYTQAIFDKTRAFISLNMQTAAASNIPVYHFEITPGPDGALDLSWQNTAFGLLLCIHPQGQADFYGDTRGGNTLKGEFDPAETVLWLFQWMHDQVNRAERVDIATHGNKGS